MDLVSVELTEGKSPVVFSCSGFCLKRRGTDS